MKKEFKLTKEGIAELEAELKDLRVKAVEIIDLVKSAREQGDLSENEEYHNAKEEQARIAGRIDEIEHILANAEVMAKRKSSAISIGSTVVVKAGGKSMTYYVVDSVEADPLEGKISDESPIGKALLGKKAGDKIEIESPTGKKSYEIKEVK